VPEKGYGCRNGSKRVLRVVGVVDFGTWGAGKGQDGRMRGRDVWLWVEIGGWGSKGTYLCDKTRTPNASFVYFIDIQPYE